MADQTLIYLLSYLHIVVIIIITRTHRIEGARDATRKISKETSIVERAGKFLEFLHFRVLDDRSRSRRSGIVFTRKPENNAAAAIHGLTLS